MRGESERRKWRGRGGGGREVGQTGSEERGRRVRRVRREGGEVAEGGDRKWERVRGRGGDG